MTDQNADVFREMASRIERNASEDFGGAAVIIPPDGEAVEVLLLDSKRDASQFWSTVKTRVELALSEIQERERSGQRR